MPDTIPLVDVCAMAKIIRYRECAMQVFLLVSVRALLALRLVLCTDAV